MKPASRRMTLEQWRGAEEEAAPRHTAKPLGDIVPDLMKQFGLTERFAEEEINRAWLEVVGYPFCNQAVPTHIKWNVLHIRIIHPTVRYAFEGIKAEVLRKLQERLGKQRVKALKIHVG